MVVEGDFEGSARADKGGAVGSIQPFQVPRVASKPRANRIQLEGVRKFKSS